MPTYRDPGPVAFDAVMVRADTTGSSAFVEFPHDVAELFGVRGRVPVLATFDDVAYQGSLVTYGGPHLILVRQDIQAQIGKGPGDTVRVGIRLDTSERVVGLAADVQAALEEGGHLAAFRAMSYSHQREYVTWVEEARRPATRQTRIARMVGMVAEGKRLK
ncbi:YdeI/OmpD-associated family protein [Georgenia sp. SYP-B2076]|uniref:YdeI/OmpD-associated family protein n=1 Tax=Georgenia sp. SYP-B2076 TaxID=2495881 RepID=UPI000F8F2966|nr:YdeI/OmpD-associated family protein [Georgenia sp. SYP-B2076]